MLTSLKRIIRTGSVGFVRSAYVSFSAIYVMVITLLVIGGSLIFGALLDHTLVTLKSKVDVNIYFTVDAEDEAILAFRKQVESLSDVKVVTYLSRDEALAQFKERHAGDELTIRALEELGENPLGASISITAHDPAQYEGIVQFINETSESAEATIIDRINFNQNKSAIDRLTNIVTIIDKITKIIVMTLVFVTVLITFNTIRLAIYTARDEVSVMRLVGASNTFIRGPFVVQGALYGVIAGVITLILLYPIAYYLGPSTDAFFGLNIFRYYLADFGRIFAIVMGSGASLGIVSSAVAISRYLRI
ncbi:hypothetical protein A3C87_03490 [Candidatus Kaiserbacteria bacterium RIFCSPHIGHO2_02_FULL_49_34]|uniref:Cell division protein FtsX n=1 Tax=Candidatus Kaiserbacteria bacterium RIFCSPHIGHO2_02_FULL_49_34 TaxID=1798491 RepID=A0A1F6DIH6_9BACT|nr:MAG: hypothetical protein A3C87_03490 [Candidatus Kaiserbacteria bacterium RIFCSPHIGHO2_02_FULL_49_34]